MTNLAIEIEALEAHIKHHSIINEQIAKLEAELLKKDNEINGLRDRLKEITKDNQRKEKIIAAKSSDQKEMAARLRRADESFAKLQDHLPAVLVVLATVAESMVALKTQINKVSSDLMPIYLGDKKVLTLYNQRKRQFERNA